MTNKVEQMKAALSSQLSEWLGFDIPDEGSEDYETWISRSNEIEEISSYHDIYEYLGGGDRADEFFASYGICFSETDD